MTGENLICSTLLEIEHVPREYLESSRTGGSYREEISNEVAAVYWKYLLGISNLYLDECNMQIRDQMMRPVHLIDGDKYFDFGRTNLFMYPDTLNGN
ncbi:hypothetical protein RUM43_005402 [Polyplax serrata]|uniref:Uncharacterized protein n=1 Tax=Polyplax serrata TaxID=468196 RepID=A0AAN8P972_POLSC